MKVEIESKSGTNYLLVDGVAKVRSKDYIYLLGIKIHMENKNEKEKLTRKSVR